MVGDLPRPRVQPPGGMALKGSSPATPLAPLLGGMPSEWVRQLSRRLTAPHPPPVGVGYRLSPLQGDGNSKSLPWPGLRPDCPTRPWCVTLCSGASARAGLAVSCFVQPPGDPLTSVIWPGWGLMTRTHWALRLRQSLNHVPPFSPTSSHLAHVLGVYRHSGSHSLSGVQLVCRTVLCRPQCPILGSLLRPWGDACH